MTIEEQIQMVSDLSAKSMSMANNEERDGGGYDGWKPSVSFRERGAALINVENTLRRIRDAGRPIAYQD
jgi:hypothetical protein